MCREGEEEDGEWRRMGHRYPGKNPWKVGRALPLMKLVQLQREHKSRTVDSFYYASGQCTSRVIQILCNPNGAK